MEGRGEVHKTPLVRHGRRGRRTGCPLFVVGRYSDGEDRRRAANIVFVPTERSSRRGYSRAHSVYTLSVAKCLNISCTFLHKFLRSSKHNTLFFTHLSRGGLNFETHILLRTKKCVCFTWFYYNFLDAT